MRYCFFLFLVVWTACGNKPSEQEPCLTCEDKIARHADSLAQLPPPSMSRADSLIAEVGDGLEALLPSMSAERRAELLAAYEQKAASILQQLEKLPALAGRDGKDRVARTAFETLCAARRLGSSTAGADLERLQGQEHWKKALQGLQCPQ